MDIYLESFESIWNKYYSILPCDSYYFNIYLRIMNKIRDNELDFSGYKISFNKLLEDMSITIYNYKYKDQPGDYDEKCEYVNDNELNCCYILKKYLKQS